MAEYRQVVYRGCKRHEDVPDGVREGDAAVGLEEEHADQVQHAAQFQVRHGWQVVLEHKQHYCFILFNRQV